MRIYFVTNRRPDHEDSPTDFSGEFNRHGPMGLRLGYVEWGDPEKKDDLKELVAAPDRTVDGKQIGSDIVFEQLKREMMTGKDAIAFIHGYNVTFKEAIFAGVRMAKNFDDKYTIIVFSWPSDGSMAPLLAYWSDRHDAQVSGPAVGRAMLKAGDFLGEVARAAREEKKKGGDPGKVACGQSLHLIVHSMGNYVLRNGLQTMVKEKGIDGLQRIFGEILLMAADEDDDCFELDHKLRALPRLGRRVHVYFNNEDMAMRISEGTKGNPDRLGNDGPRLPLQVPVKVDLVDCTPVVNQGIAEHSYYLDCPPVIRDMTAVLKGNSAERIEYRDYIQSKNRYRLKTIGQ